MRSLEITTRIGCTLGCSYCPQSVLESKYQSNHILSLDNFWYCMTKLPQDCLIYFSGFCEPFLNSNTKAMICNADIWEHKIGVNTTLLGLWTIKDIDHIKFQNFAVHLLDVEMDTQVWNGYFDILDEVINKVHNVELRKHAELKPEVAEFVKDMKVRQVPLNNRAGNLQKEVCKKGNCNSMSRNVLLPNGDITLCCMDYGLECVLGNLIDEDYDTIIGRIPDNLSICDRCVYNRKGEVK